MGLLLFYFAAAVTVSGAVGVVALPNPLYSVLSLIAAFLGLAGLYLSLSAESISVVQVVVYAGAIMVLFLFVVMLLDMRREERIPLRLPVQKFAGSILGVGIFTLLVRVFSSDALLTGVKGTFTAERVSEMGNTQVIGRLLLSDYLLPFQAMGVLLFVGVIGAVVLAMRRIG